MGTQRWMESTGQMTAGRAVQAQTVTATPGGTAVSTAEEVPTDTASETAFTNRLF